MVQVDAGTRLRLIMIVTVLATLLGGMMLAGLLQRMGTPPPGVEDPADEVTLTQAREQAEQGRAIRKQLASLGKERHWREAAALAGSKLKDADRPFLHFLHAEALIRAGEFEKAVPEIDKSLMDGNPVAEAERLAFLGDRDGYRQYCENVLKAAHDEALGANNTAWLCVALKDGLPNYDAPLALARRAVADVKNGEDRWVYLNTLGAVLYRAGQNQEAQDRLMEAETLHPDPFNWPFLAMAQAGLGDTKKAHYWLDRLKAKLDTTYATNDLSHSRHELLLFLHEAEAIIPPLPPTSPQ